MKTDYVYLDNAATTKVIKEAKDESLKYLDELYYNPSALYNQAIEVSRVIKNARKKTASLLGVDENTLIFTSSGTESDNQALFCTSKKKCSRIIISETEHSAVYNSAMELKQRGYDVVVAPVDAHGRVDKAQFEKLIDEKTSLVSVMHVNNVTGAINDIKGLVDILKSKNDKALFHSDGVQAFGKIAVKPKNLGVDLYSVSSHKVGAPKGSGFLYVRQGLNVSPLLYGGGQERGLRSSTENVSAIAAFAEAASITCSKMQKLNQNGQDFFGKIKEYVSTMDDVKILSDDYSAPHILCLCFEKVRGETLMHALEGYGYVVGIGSACSSKKGTPRIPKALGLEGGYKEGLLRISINAYDDYDADAFIKALDECINTLKKYVRI